ncbi:hypothetical protein [Aquibacillus kalidii]|uniref:hypothetical protein n=1 Tax=Aquibacillus kalidii TaxID=2762597 RepID=UPI001648BABD|nr:hypothetical protein [Aquibacillus kalidii]
MLMKQDPKTIKLIKKKNFQIRIVEQDEENHDMELLYNTIAEILYKEALSKSNTN